MIKALKILQITISATYGGGPEHLYLLEKYINRKKYVMFTACPKQKPYYEKFNSLSEECFEIPYRKFSLKRWFNLIRFARRKQIDIIHCHGKGAGIYGRLLYFFSGIPVIYTLHGISFGGKSAFKKNAYFIVERILNRNTKKIINVSHSEMNLGLKLKLYKREQATVIPNGIEHGGIYSHERQKIGLNNSDYVIGNISRLCYQKGLIFLLEAFAKVQVPNKKLLIIGDGPDRLSIEEQIRELGIEQDVILLGMRTDTRELISLFDMYVTTARWEGLPISLLEVMSAGVPVVASNVTGNNELIIDGYTGLLCKAKDSEDTADKIYRMYISENKKKYAENAKSLINKRYTVEKMVHEIELLYSSFEKGEA